MMDDLTKWRCYQELANAIIIYAVYDLRCYYRDHMRNPYNRTAKDRVAEMKQFFCSDFFKVLTNLNGEVLFNDIVADMDENPNRKIRRESYGISWKRTHGS